MLLYAFDRRVCAALKQRKVRRESLKVMTLLRHYPFLSISELRDQIRKDKVGRSTPHAARRSLAAATGVPPWSRASPMT